MLEKVEGEEEVEEEADEEVDEKDEDDVEEGWYRAPAVELVPRSAASAPRRQLPALTSER